MEALRQLLGIALLDGLRTKFLLGKCRGIRVETEQHLLVAKGVLLLDSTALGLGLTLGVVEDALQFGAVDQTGKVGLGDKVGREREAALALVDAVQGLESSRGPDDEATKMATRGELEEVESVDRAGLNAGDVAEAVDQLLAVNLGVVDNQGPTSLAVATATKLTLTGTELLGALDTLDLRTSTNSVQEAKSSRRLAEKVAFESLRVNNEGNFSDVGNLVTAGKDKGSDGGGSKSGSDSETPISR